MVQILAGLITYLLLAIYCHDEYNERVRELRIKIRNEIASCHYNPPDPKDFKDLDFNAQSGLLNCRWRYALQEPLNN